MPDANAWHSPCSAFPLASWDAQHKEQAPHTTQLPRQYSQSRHSNPVAITEAAKAEFSKAAIADEVTSKVLQQYKPCLQWETNTKLRPALERWVDLGSQQLSARLVKHPQLLVCTPEQCSDVHLWLASVGTDTDAVQEQAPEVLSRELSQVQGTLRAIQQAMQLEDLEVPNSSSSICSP